MVKKLLVGFVMVMVVAGVGSAQTPVQRCFTFTGNIRANAPNTTGPIVASMGSGWVSQTPFYNAGVTANMAVSYNICVNGDNSANIQSSSLYHVGGSGNPELGYPRPDGPYNMILPATGQILLGDANEYVQLVFDPAYSFNLWAINDTFTLVHSAHILFNPPYSYNNNTFYDWVSRIYVDGWISEIDPYCGEGTNDTDCDGIINEEDPCPELAGECPSGSPLINYLPELNCDGIDDGSCLGRYSLAQMGYFDNGGAWIWNLDFRELMEFQHYSNPVTHPELWTPIKSNGLITDGPWRNTDYRLDRRTYSDGGEFTMLNLLLQTGESIKYPTVYLAQDDQGNQWVNVWFGPIDWPDVGICAWEGDPHAQCDGTNPNNENEPNGNPWDDISPDNPVACCRPFGDAMANPWVDMINTEELTEDRINFVRWENTAEVEYNVESYDGGTYTYIRYALMQDGGNNMWQFDYSTSYAQNSPMIRYHFPSMITAIGDQIFTINYDDGKEGQLTIFASDIREMPIIAPTITQTSYTAAKNKKSKKEVKKKGKAAKKKAKAVKMFSEETVVDNILVREVVDPLDPDAGQALVIQWPEPDAALFGGMQLRVYVSGFEMNAVGDDDFLFLDAPAQTGTVVFPQDVWMPYKQRMQAIGNTEISLSLMYRVTSARYHNRGQSYTTFQIQ